MHANRPTEKSPAMSRIHATELASLTSEVTRLASLSDDVLALELRDLPREALLRLRLTCQNVFFWKALLLIRITQNGRRPAPDGAHRNWTYRD